MFKVGLRHLYTVSLLPTDVGRHTPTFEKQTVRTLKQSMNSSGHGNSKTLFCPLTCRYI